MVVWAYEILSGLEAIGWCSGAASSPRLVQQDSELQNKAHLLKLTEVKIENMNSPIFISEFCLHKEKSKHR